MKNVLCQLVIGKKAQRYEMQAIADVDYLSWPACGCTQVRRIAVSREMFIGCLARSSSGMGDALP
jgi:hypothetical protein